MNYLQNIRLTNAQKIILWCFSIVGLLVVNGLFLYTLFFKAELIGDAQQNLYSLAFIMEAFLLIPLFCFLIYVAKLNSPGWIGFLILSILGSLAFSIPFSILMWQRRD